MVKQNHDPEETTYRCQPDDLTRPFCSRVIAKHGNFHFTVYKLKELEELHRLAELKHKCLRKA